MKIIKKDFYNKIEDLVFLLKYKSNFDCEFKFDDKKEGSSCTQICKTSGILIGTFNLSKYNDNDIVPNYILTDVIVNIFHEYQHALRNYEMYHNFQKGCEEIYVSSFTNAYFHYYYHLKHRMSPNELDAELYGILNAKAFFEEFYPEFDFESAIVERINELFEDNCWYGPFNDSELKMVFSYEEIVDYLKSWQRIAYNYNPPLDIKDVDFQKTVEYSLLDVKDNGIKHYDDMLQYIKEFKTLSYEDNILINKLVAFSKEKVMLEKIKDEVQFELYEGKE